MTLVPTPRSTLDLETTFGRVRVYEFGAASADRAAIPVVLLPGRTSGVPCGRTTFPTSPPLATPMPSMPWATPA